jgi:hypothetical protein
MGINNPKPKEPPIKIKIEVRRDITKTCNANLIDRSLKVYNNIANKIEQIIKGNNNWKSPSKMRIFADANIAPKNMLRGKDKIPIKKNIRYTHGFSFMVVESFIILLASF